MSVITRCQKGICVYWPPGSEGSGGVDFDNYGQPVYSDPVELNCRWDDTVMEYIDSKGTMRSSRAVVIVESDVSVGGVLFNGSLSALIDLTTPKNNDGAWEIRRFDKTPNFKYTEYLREAYL